MRQRLVILLAGLSSCAIASLPAAAASQNTYGVSAAVVFNKSVKGGGNVDLVVRNLNTTTSRPFHVSFDYGIRVSGLKLQTYAHEGRMLFYTPNFSLPARQQHSFPLVMTSESASGNSDCYIISVSDAKQAASFGDMTCVNSNQPSQLVPFVAYPMKSTGTTLPIRVVVHNFGSKLSAPYYLWFGSQRTGPFAPLKAGNETVHSVDITPDPDHGSAQFSFLGVALSTSASNAYEPPFSYFTAYVAKQQ